MERQELIQEARVAINIRFHTTHKTHNEMMADVKTSAAFIGFMMGYELANKQKSFNVRDINHG
jgi:hypothetical protein